MNDWNPLTVTDIFLVFFYVLVVFLVFFNNDKYLNYRSSVIFLKKNLY